MAKKNPHAVALGKRGGDANTEAQRQGRLRTIAIARQSRWPDRKAQPRHAKGESDV